MKMEVTDDNSELTAKLEQTALHKAACYGIFGVLELTTGPYLVVIESAKILGQILDCDVMKVTSLLYIPVNNAVHPIQM
jgi:hypothetical protein